MAGEPHNKEGRKCSRCPHIFTKTCLTLTISTRRDKFHIAELVCATCHHKHYSKGE